MGAVTKWTCSGFAAVANRDLFGLGNFEFLGQFAGIQLFMGPIAVRFVGRLPTGAIMFETFCFVNHRRFIFVGHDALLHYKNGFVLLALPITLQSPCQIQRSPQNIYLQRVGNFKNNAQRHENSYLMKLSRIITILRIK
jgi:hypothetical protein